MSPPADLVVVSSPLQYMNAVELRRASDRAADLVVIGDRHGGGETIDALMARHPPLWRRVTRHPKRPRPAGPLPAFVRDALDAGHRASLERLARRFAGERYGAVAIGDYRNVSQRLLAARSGAGRFVLLDDGSVAPQAAAFRAGRTPDPGQFALGWFRTAIGKAGFGEAPLSEPHSVVFFTIYGALMREALAESDAIEANDYAAWRALGGTKPSGPDVWLLGSNHAAAGICAEADYRALILAGVAALRAEGRGRIFYRPHRGEDRAAAEALAREAGMDFAPSPTPVELDYLDAAERPGVVAVVASSAADTLAVIDPALDLARIALPAGYLRRRREHILAVVAGHDRFNPRLRVIGPHAPADPGAAAAP